MRRWTSTARRRACAAAAAQRQGYLCEAGSRGGVLTLVGAPMMGTQDGRVSIPARLTGEPQDVMFGDAQRGWSVQASDERDGQAVSMVIVSLRLDRVFQVGAMSFARNGRGRSAVALQGARAGRADVRPQEPCQITFLRAPTHFS
jgi:hypothetical protein